MRVAASRGAQRAGKKDNRFSGEPRVVERPYLARKAKLVVHSLSRDEDCGEYVAGVMPADSRRFR